jgi:hypothetical protein
MRYNEGKQFSIPKKGSKEYDEVKIIYEEMKNPEPEIDLSAPNKKKLKVTREKKMALTEEEEPVKVVKKRTKRSKSE